MKLYLFGLAVLLVLMACCVAGQKPVSESEFFARHPIVQAYELNSGVVVALPFYAQETELTLLTGTISFSGLKQLRQLARNNLVPVGNAATDLAIARLFLVNYRRSCVGPYQEVILTVPVSRNGAVKWVSGQDIATALSDPRVLNYPLKLYLSEQVPIDAGREIWDMNKAPYSFQFAYNSTPTSLNVTVRDPRGDGNVVLAASLNHTSGWLVSSYSDIQSAGITDTKTYTLSFAGDFSVRLWNPSYDSLLLTSQSAETAIFLSNNFQPVSVLYQSNVMIALSVDGQYKQA